MMLVSTSVFVIESAPQNVCCQLSSPQEEPHWPSASLKGSPSSSGGSDSGFFQFSASFLGLRAHEILCAALKTGVWGILWLTSG